MRRTITPTRKIRGRLRLPGDKSIAHRAVLLSLLAKGPLTIKNFPDSADCRTSLEAVRQFGVEVSGTDETLVLTPPTVLTCSGTPMIDCRNSGTTARLLAGIVAGSDCEVTLTGDESLRTRPMRRIIDPLTQMGGRFFAEGGHLPMRICGRRLSPIVYDLPVASAQVKSAVLLAGLASSCGVTVRETSPTRDHTEIMVRQLGGDLRVREVKPVAAPDPDDPRKTKRLRPESFRKEITVSADSRIRGGTIDIPGDLSTAAFFLAAAALMGQSLTIENAGLNPTRTAFLDHLKAIGCQVEVTGRTVVSGEPRGIVSVTGKPLKPRKISGHGVVGLIDEIPIVSVLAAFAAGTTVIRDAQELRHKECDRLAATHENLLRMGVKCGLMEDGLVIEGGGELSGADFRAFGDHRIAMAFSVAALGLTGPSTIDDDAVVGVSCPGFYHILDSIIR